METTTCNPLGKWDCHGSIDGGWDFSIEELPERATFAILSPEGGWQEKGRLLWFGMAADEREDWPERFREIYEINVAAGYKPVLRDYHT